MSSVMFVIATPPKTLFFPVRGFSDEVSAPPQQHRRHLGKLDIECFGLTFAIHFNLRLCPGGIEPIINATRGVINLLSITAAIRSPVLIRFCRRSICSSSRRAHRSVGL